MTSAVRAIGRLDSVEVATASSLYETAPVGLLDQPQFLNAVIAVRTDLPPPELLRAMLRIEQEHGRERTGANSPRTLDLDLLLYGNREIDEPGLTVPHPRVTERCFVLLPVLEIAPLLVHPVTRRPLANCAAALNCSDVAACGCSAVGDIAMDL